MIGCVLKSILRSKPGYVGSPASLLPILSLFSPPQGSAYACVSVCCGTKSLRVVGGKTLISLFVSVKTKNSWVSFEISKVHYKGAVCG